MADGVDSVTAELADAVADADTGCKPRTESDRWISRSEDDRDRFAASDEEKRFIQAASTDERNDETTSGCESASAAKVEEPEATLNGSEPI